MSQARRPTPEVLAYCHPKDLAWMEAEARGDLEEAVKLFEIQKHLGALPPDREADSRLPFALDTFAGVDHEPETGTFSNWVEPAPMTLKSVNDAYERCLEAAGCPVRMTVRVPDVVPMSFEGEKP